MRNKVIKLLFLITFQLLNTSCFINTKIQGLSLESIAPTTPTTENPALITIVTNSLYVATNSSLTFTVQNGTPPYVYTVKSGQGTIDPTAKTFTSATATGATTISVTDSKGTSTEVSFTIYDQLSFPFSSVSIASGFGVNHLLPSIKGGVPPYVYSVVSGSGQVNSANGTYTTPIDINTSVVRVTDALGSSSETSISSSSLLVNGDVKSMVELNGNLYVGGNFRSLNPNSAPYFVALDETTGDLTSLPCNWYNGINGIVTSVVVNGDSYYIAGDFTNYANTPVQRIVKINASTCELDTNFSQTLGFDQMVRSLVIAEGSLYVGGEFLNYRGVATNRLAKLNLGNGNLDTTFTQTSGLNGHVYKLISDGISLYVAGAFLTYRSTSARGVLKLNLVNGDLDSTFHTATGANSDVYALAYHAGSLYIGGIFTDWRGTTLQRIAKIDASTGAIDTTFSQATGFSSNVEALLTDGISLYVGGYFATYRGTSATGLAKIALDTGNLDSTFTQNPMLGFAFTNLYPHLKVKSLLLDGTSLYVGGGFGFYQGTPTSGLIKINKITGVLDTGFTKQAGFDVPINYLYESVMDIAKKGNSILVGGAMTLYRGQLAHNLAKINLSTGVIDQNFTQSPSGFNGIVKSVVTDGTSIYVGGDFTSYRGISANNIVKLDAITGNMDSTFNSGSGFSNKVNAMVISGNSIYATGEFATYNGLDAKGLAKLDKDSGALDTIFSTATCLTGGGSLGSALQVVGSSLFVGGYFTNYRGTGAEGIAKVDLITGALVGGFPHTAVFGSFMVQGLAYDGTSLYMGACPSSGQYQSVAVGCVIKINPTTGAIDTGFNTGTEFLGGNIYSMFAHGTSLFVSGALYSHRGASIPQFVKTNTSADLDTTFNLNTMISGDVTNTMVTTSGDLIVAGTIKSASGKAAGGLVFLSPATGIRKR